MKKNFNLQTWFINEQICKRGQAAKIGLRDFRGTFEWI